MSKLNTAFEVSLGKANSGITKLLNELGTNGREALERLDGDPVFVRRCARFMCAGGITFSPYQNSELSAFDLRLQAIMGRNFFGVNDWSVFYDVNFTEEQLRAIPKFPWDEEILNSPCPFNNGRTIKETHFTFLGLEQFNGTPLTIKKWVEIHSEKGETHFYDPSPIKTKGNTFANYAWFNEPTCKWRWYLMPLQSVISAEHKASEEHKTYEELLTMLPEEYEVSLAIEDTTKLWLFFRKNGIALDYKADGWCLDVDSRGERVAMTGINTSLGLSSTCFHYRAPGWGDFPGLVASRKLPNPEN